MEAKISGSVSILLTLQIYKSGMHPVRAEAIALLTKSILDYSGSTFGYGFSITISNRTNTGHLPR
jgi:hypothetical protein